MTAVVRRTFRNVIKGVLVEVHSQLKEVCFVYHTGYFARKHRILRENREQNDEYLSITRGTTCEGNITDTVAVFQFGIFQRVYFEVYT